MNRYLVLLALMALAAHAQYAVPSVHDQCESQCSPTDYTCCGCCGTDSNCSGNKISKRCCPTSSSFCGCISDRGFCSGSVFNQTTQVNGTDTFGSCFDPTAATCTYEASPNLWVVCPKDYQPCTSSSFFSCCAPDSYCVTNTYNSSYPICQPRSAPASTKASTTVVQPTQPPTSNSKDLAVPSVHNDCGSTCSSNAGCCGSDSTCQGNAVSSRCCPNSSSFCGCISNRAFCSGSVYNSTRVSGYDTFGACFDSSAATCTYEPSPNLWVVCPKDYQPCTSSSFFSCCAPDSYCVTNTYNSSYPICQPRSTGGVAPTKSSNCPSGLSSCGDACYRDSEYCCVNGGLVQKQFCGAASTGDSTKASTSSTNAPASSTKTPTSPAGLCGAGLLQCGTACYTDDQYCCVNGNLVQKPFCAVGSTPDTKSSTSATKSSVSPSTTNGGICAGKCAGQSCCATPEGSKCYVASSYTCATDDLGNSQLCPLGLSACGLSCYNPAQYSCKNGNLQHY